ncbi:uncharacterized protein LOC127842638 isoform X2 [Dreissena polymorpha]|uniref:glucose-6-phosphate 1-epimerase n=2 Tax=Dreissena polymorpha TaxID=45954 RepID=A0A9D4EL07_DREPO|nr:uncharacterized protein LOC127842638 isoform X2 [Dreissena polymorpha]XP_052228225.1 uncharacterized protein LOC127842638 isoform X2 [Dreissena polymorpha]XP_052228226.1 uncharacterized protein LOC127842638 isoform X2 [Dreissena polymorpha]XP_052228227.1 uncharacterized protein LOC127842638 isoform X2 [Dreissena polymorpha]KAH3781735.1 hypothetical protein DPMN_159639 [Dreissena polymorpha]
MPTVSFKNDTGSEVTVNLFGATVTSWKHEGEEFLFCSKQAVFDDKKAIRGGIPIVFPQFGPWDLGPQHGFARIKMWKQTSEAHHGDNGAVSMDFALEDDDETRKMWNKQFKLVYTVTLMQNTLETALTVHNTGDTEFDFTTLLHTYMRVEDIYQTSLHGLEGCTFSDKVNGGEHVEDRASIIINQNYDRVYVNVDGPVNICQDIQTLGTLRIERNNLPDVVVWNPWQEKAKAMADLADSEYVEMLCVEAGAVSSPVVLKSGEQKTFSQRLIICRGQQVTL